MSKLTANDRALSGSEYLAKLILSKPGRTPSFYDRCVQMHADRLLWNPKDCPAELEINAAQRWHAGDYTVDYVPHDRRTLFDGSLGECRAFIIGAMLWGGQWRDGSGS